MGRDGQSKEMLFGHGDVTQPLKDYSATVYDFVHGRVLKLGSVYMINLLYMVNLLYSFNHPV